MRAIRQNDGQRRSRRTRLLVLLALFAAGLGAAWAWFERETDGPVAITLPARPKLTGSPELFTSALARAEDLAASSATQLKGVEELGRLYQANGYNDEAAACWRLLREHQPREARWCYLLAMVRLAAGDGDEAMSLLGETLDRAPGYGPAVLQRAELLFKTGNFDEASRDYRRRLELVPGDPYARLGLARIALQQRRSSEARTMIEELIRDVPNFATVHNLYAQILEADGDEARAKWHRWLGVETLRYVPPKDPWLDELQSWCYNYNRICVLGSVETLRDNPHGAMALYERAIEVDPTALDAYQLLAALHFEKARPAEALVVLERARAAVTEDDLTPLFTDLCRAHRELNQPDVALTLAREGLARKQQSPELLEALGLAFADLGRHPEAVQAYESALVRKANDASINYNLAVSLLSLGRLDEVLAALDRSLVMQPTFPPAMLLRARIEMAAGHWAEAEAYLRPVFESHRENAEARRLLAEWHLHMGREAERNDADDAERHYREGVSIDPDYADVQATLGLFLLVRSRPAEAVAPLETYHRLQPESAPGCLFLGQAYEATGRREEARAILTRGRDLADRSANRKTADACRELLGRL